MAFERYLVRTYVRGENNPVLDIHAVGVFLEAFLYDGKTAQQCEDFIEAILTRRNGGTSVQLSTNDKADISATLSYIQAGADDTKKNQRMQRFYRIVIGSEKGSLLEEPLKSKWYGTQDSMRTKLNWSEQD